MGCPVWCRGAGARNIMTIDMHAHWKPLALMDALRQCTTEPRITRNSDGVEVMKTDRFEVPVRPPGR